MNACGRIRCAIALAVLGAGSLACRADPSIPLRVSLTIPETCTIAPAAAGTDQPGVSCTHGTPFVLSHAPAPDSRLAPPRSIGAGAPPAWTVTF
ncbi:hypothetical protein [Burkholderia pseudomultivorans]|uniref:Lipoprotein n=1 Tax=Burkholderia pseudomultivorans TaxID=1207504 RepID=A0A132EGF2_9BURK|nr:hypothetical protein [Burkholderia pseudomultivorans]KWF29810.1 hypothetical protein WT56_15560 [Burkholderia pseudomultivorans]MDR8730096.1 hypothetical protein [Burkholderia pseudomultivorans]MDR8734681.1 hypothetical protein [Burkholderia pseudomultivorans]MDR8740647.1 hypothetical protein [Burkholderia pseudomultivorans]MDR8751688.1 hypothetical protein [Burkholderia pseudomultivorans]